MPIYLIETAYAGSLQGGHLLGVAEGLDMLDACDNWACAKTGREDTTDAWAAIGISRDDVIAYPATDEE
jgi:hypothetical protein